MIYKKNNKNLKLYKLAKKIIPGGNHLLSKRPELYLPDGWPTYYSKAKGAYVWDLNNNKYLDMLFAVGTNVLGYANTKIDSKIYYALKKSNMSSLNSFEEVYLAKELLKIHPWAEMVRFARTGGEANSIAIRIARAYSNKDKVAVCGYHGWHDWYLSANLNKNKDNLKKHILPGLKPVGVPKKLKNTVFTFQYGDIDSLRKILAKNNIGVIKMEVARSSKPDIDFLKKVKKICISKKIILIFDECTSGFRESYGGLHKTIKINPDMAMFSKAIGNGYAISAIIGKKNIMQAAQNTFISSTNWTEKLGFVAGIETIKLMKKTQSWKKISKIGKIIIKNWKKISKKNNVPIDINHSNSIPSFNFLGKNKKKYKTFLTQYMLSKNILASNIIYVSVVHNKSILKKYFKNLDNCFSQIKEFEKNPSLIKKKLKFKVCDEGFKRLN